jgi:hypothetical protein
VGKVLAGKVLAGKVLAQKILARKFLARTYGCTHATSLSLIHSLVELSLFILVIN